MKNCAFKMILCSLFYLLEVNYLRAEILPVSPVERKAKMLDMHLDSKLIKHLRSVKKIQRITASKNKVRHLIFQKWKKTNDVDLLMISIAGVGIILFALVVLGLLWLSQFVALWVIILLALSILLVTLFGFFLLAVGA